MDFPLDDRVEGMIGGFDVRGQPVPIQREHMIAKVATWPISDHTPQEISEQLRVSRELFVHSLLVWEFSAVGAAWSLMAVESALRWSLDATNKETLFKLIDKGEAQELYGPATTELLHTGRQIRNSFNHPKNQPAFTIGMSAPILQTSHRIVVEISEAVHAKNE